MVVQQNVFRSSKNNGKLYSVDIEDCSKVVKIKIGRSLNVEMMILTF